MSDRPRSDGPEDGPEYSWLYGKNRPPQPAPHPAPHPGQPDATRPVPQEPRDPAPDATRVMRTQPRQPVRPTPPPLAPTPGDPGLPPGGPPPSYGGPSGPRLRRPRFRLRYVFIVFFLWLAFIVATPIITWNSVDKVDFQPSGSRPAEQPGTTYLMVGSDSRKGLTKEQRKEYATGDASGQRTDTIMLLHTGSGPNLLMSIPRDSIVDIPGHGSGKINAAYAYGGAKLLTKTIENETGIRVDQYVEIGMGGVVGIVDAVGGIEVCPRMNMKDKLAGLNIKKGCQDVDGRVALAYARSRHTAALGDIDRARRQREVVSAVGKKVLSPWTVVNPVRWWKLNHAIPDFFKFGDTAGPVRAGQWAMAMSRVNGKEGLTCGVPIADLAVHWDADRSEQLFKKIIDDDTSTVTKKLCTASGIEGQN